MPKPIDQLDFWKKRIDHAKEAGVPHYSVYLTSSFHIIDAAHKKIIQDLGVDGKILDAGCGYGRYNEWFEDYTGVDFSPDFIEEAKRLYPGRNFLVANLKELPFESNEFDWAVCISIKQMVIGNLGGEEWEKMIKEISRVAKRVLILEYEEPEKYQVCE